MQIGTYQTLKIVRHKHQGLYLSNSKGEEVLLPHKYMTPEMQVGHTLNVFVYLDNEERLVATTLLPKITVNRFGYLKCTSVSKVGAFLDWGLDKELLVPYREQVIPMREGNSYLVFMYEDPVTNRLVASSRTNRFLNKTRPDYGANQEVRLIVSHQTEKGWICIINEKHTGLLYTNEIFRELYVGDTLTGYIKKVREDDKIDLALQPLGHEALEPNAERLYAVLQTHNGYLPLTDKSNPEEIKDMVQLSKKSFKRAVGVLYKARKIRLEEGGIYVLHS